MTASNPKPSPLPAKKKSWIRTQLLLLLSLFVLLGWTYTYFFFDQHLRLLAQWGLGKVNGAEVNIGAIKTSFTSLSMSWHQFQMTNSAQPGENLVAFDQCKFNLDVYHLLKAKVVIEEASLLGLRFHDPRERPGKVFPPPPQDSTEKKNPLIQAFEQKKQEWLKDQWENSALADLLSLFEAKNLEEGAKQYLSQLQTQQKIEDLGQQLLQAQDRWKVSGANREMLDQWKNRSQEIKNFKLAKEPQEIAQQIKQVEEWKKLLKQDMASFSQQVTSLTGDIKNFKQQMGSIPQWIDADIERIKASLKLPTLDPKAFARGLWEPFIFSKIAPYLGYWNKVNPYWSKWQQRKQEAAPEPPSRSAGITFHFPKRGQAPSFWLQKLVISARDRDRDRFEGQLQHVSSAPASLGLPISLSLKGDSPSRQLKDFSLQLQVLFPQDQPFTVLGELGIGSLMIQELLFSKSSKLLLGLKQVPMNLKSHLVIKGLEQFDFKVLLAASQYQWLVQSPEPRAQQVLGDILGRITQLNTNIEFHGPWERLDWQVSSNIGEALIGSVKQEFEQQLKLLKNRLTQQIGDLIAQQKEKLIQSLSGSERELLGPLLAQENNLQEQGPLLDQLKQKLEDKIKNKAKEKAAEKLGDKIDVLKKKIKLPF